MSIKPTNPLRTALEVQTTLNIHPLKEIEIDGIGMGVLSDGTPYLTGRGLASMCGLTENTIRELSENWSAEQFKPRGIAMSNLLVDHGYPAGKPLFIPVVVKGITHHAFPDSVCMAFLEYYALDATPRREQAIKNYRTLAKSSLKAFIYVQVGYDPINRIPDCWRKFHDRVSLTYHKVPPGYFSIFKEMADMIVSMIQGGVPVDQHTMPDASVGTHWGNYWKENKCAENHGERIRYEHNFPDDYPQARSNPQHPWAYPDAALPEFRQWMRDVYLIDKFPGYLDSQEKRRSLPPSVRILLLNAISTPAQIA